MSLLLKEDPWDENWHIGSSREGNKMVSGWNGALCREFERGIMEIMGFEIMVHGQTWMDLDGRRCNYLFFFSNLTKKILFFYFKIQHGNLGVIPRRISEWQVSKMFDQICEGQ